MTNYDKRLILGAFILLACFVYMFLTKDASEFCKSVIIYIVGFFFGSSDKKGKEDK